MYKKSLHLHEVTRALQIHLERRDTALCREAVKAGLICIGRTDLYVTPSQRSEFLAHATAFAYLANERRSVLLRYHNMLAQSSVSVGKKSIRPELHPLVNPIIYDYFNPQPHSMQMYAESKFSQLLSWLSRKLETFDELINNGYETARICAKVQAELHEARVTPRP